MKRLRDGSVHSNKNTISLTSLEIPSVIFDNTYESKRELLIRKLYEYKNKSNGGKRQKATSPIKIAKKHPIYKWIVTTSTTPGIKEIAPDNRQINEGVPFYYWIMAQIDMAIYNMEKFTLIEIDKKGNKDKKIILKDSKWLESNLPKLQNFYLAVLKYTKERLPDNFDFDDNNNIKLYDDLSNISYKNILKGSNPTINFAEWVSGSRVRNYIIGDPLVDWLELYYEKNNNFIGSNNRQSAPNKSEILSNNAPENSPSSANNILVQGIKFEENVINYLYNKYPKNIIHISSDPSHARSLTKYRQTFAAMKKNVPIIYQGVVYNWKDKTYGMPDLMVRSDWINKLFDEKILLTSDANINAPNLSRYHYRIIDIKLSKLRFKVDGEHLLNSPNIAAYKSQVYIYNKALAEMQGYDPQQAYILGRRWEQGYKLNNKQYYDTSNSCFDRLGIVDFKEVDVSIIQKTEEAISWLRDLRTSGHRWSIFPKPSRVELYPNMCIDDDKWKDVKKYIAEKLEDVTLVSYCSPKNRLSLIKNFGISTWRNKKCTAKNLGINGPIISERVNKILAINQQTNKNKIHKVLPKKLVYNVDNWINTNDLEFYVDFESVTDIVSDFSKLPFSDYDNIIYLIGVGYVYKKTFRYRKFVVDKLSNSEEKRILKEFHKYLNRKTNGKPYKLYHYGNHEQSMFATARKKHKFNWDITQWFDVHKNIILKEPVTFYGSLNFGLKSIAKTMYSNNLIKTIWKNDGVCKNGLDALVLAKDCNDDSIKKGIKMKKHPIMKDIINYNEVDCKVLYEIVEYLRINHA